MKIQINGSSHEASAGERLVDVINRVSKGLPQVCYHPQLGPIQTCDTCLVEINGTLARACGTKVSAGMKVFTESVTAQAAQREAFDRILGNHQLYCTVCPCNALMEKSMLGEAGYMTAVPQKALNGMIDLVKGIEPEIGYGSILKVSEVEANMRESRIRRTKTVCTYCGVGCSFDIWTKDRHILKVEPLEGPANGISTCVKGKFGWDYVNDKDRLTKPLIREGDHFRETSWEEALELVASKFGQIKQANGPDSIGFIASSKCTNEEAYLMQKLARAVVGTNNIDNCSRYCQSPAAMERRQ